MIGLATLLSVPLWSQEPPATEPIQPIPSAHDQHLCKVELGERLFNDPRLSADDTVSCARCHRLGEGGADGLPRSIGIRGAQGVINSPTVFNTRFNVAQLWDGRARTLEEQVDDPLHNPAEMDTNWPDVVTKLELDPKYAADFGAIYEEGITPATIRDAIATFERSLTTPNSRFDRWLWGDEEALSEQEREGYDLFKSYGCAACHQGMSVGGNMFQRMGTFGDYFADRGGEIEDVDLGRLNVTGEEEDRYHFKVPSLRLAVRTPPYFHDGNATTLENAIEMMGRYQLGREIPDEHVTAISAFLESLVGEHARLEP